MNITNFALPKGILMVLFTALLGMVPVAQAATVEDLEGRIEKLERLLNGLKQQQMDAAKMEQKEQQREAAEIQKLKDEVASAKEQRGFGLTEKSKLSFYGSIRPALTYFDNQVRDLNGFNYEIASDDSSLEVTDFFTRVGVKGETDVGYGLTAFARVEMEIDIGQAGDFQQRLAFAGFEGAFGRLAIGRQWHPHYNTIVEVTDVYNHRSSPFGYDQQGPFRRPNLVTYSKAFNVGGGSLKLDTGVQFSRDAGNVSGSNDNRPGADSGAIGLGFKNDLFYLGASYLERKRDNGLSREYYGLGASISPIDNLYLAATVQKIEQERGATGDDNGHSIDLVGSYGFGNGYKIILGWFDVDAAGLPGADNNDQAVPCAAQGIITTGTGSCGYTSGYNVTLQRQVSDNFRVFAEWLHFEYDNNAPDLEDSVNAISTGVRYDFSLDF